MDKTSLGDRIKNYEDVSRKYLIPKIPVIIRIDGRAFHSLKLEKPFDSSFVDIMQYCSKSLFEEVANLKMIYGQSDELSLLLFDNGSYMTQPWFDNNHDKLVSISASTCSVSFTKSCWKHQKLYIFCQKDMIKNIVFDARTFNLPIHEVANYFIWRQKDATRNSIQMLGRNNFSHKQLDKKSCDEIQDMLFKKHNINWNDTETKFKRGWCYTKEGVDNEIPIFTQDRNYIDKYLKTDKI